MTDRDIQVIKRRRHSRRAYLRSILKRRVIRYWKVGGYYDFSFQSRFSFLWGVIVTLYLPSLLLNNDSILLTNHRFILITYWVVKLFNFDLYWSFFRCNTIPPIFLFISYLSLNRSMDIGEKKKLSDSIK